MAKKRELKDRLRASRFARDMAWNTNNALRDEVKHLRAKVEAQGREMRILADNRKAVIEENRRLEEEVERHKSAIASFVGERGQARMEVESLKDENAELLRVKNAIHDHRKMVIDKNRQLEAENSMLRDKNHGKAEAIVKLDVENAALKDKVGQLEVFADTAAKTIGTLQRNYIAACKRAGALLKENATLNRSIESLEGKR